MLQEQGHIACRAHCPSSPLIGATLGLPFIHTFVEPAVTYGTEVKRCRIVFDGIVQTWLAKARRRKRACGLQPPWQCRWWPTAEVHAAQSLISRRTRDAGMICGWF